jgi:outer membrane protein OmpA-like peptidoglycan-associated protein/tetratricopeptide (TPR) repeat protein
MKKKFEIIFGLVLLLLMQSAYAQVNKEFTRENFPDKKSEVKKALKDIEQGDGFLYEEYPKYSNALECYEKANDFNPDNASVNFKMGICTIKGKGNKTSSIVNFEKAYKLKADVNADVLFWLGSAYQLDYQFDKAIDSYKKYMNGLTGKLASEKSAELNKRIAECETGKILIQQEERVFIDNLGNTVNSQYDEYGPVITADESMLLFTSKRPYTDMPKIDGGELFEDIYLSYKRNKNWKAPDRLGKPLNTEYHDAVKGLSNDGSKLIVYKGDNGGDLFESKMTGSSWSKPERYPKQINSDYHEASGSFSYDGKVLYFVSDKPGGFGGHDIYKSTKLEKGKWSEAINLGSVVNTAFDETAVFAHPDGKTLYFSSKGHNTMGGYDIFKSTFENNVWTKPVNIGYPINTTDDDVFFVISASGKHGFYSSIKEGGNGGQDLYMITFLGPDKIFTFNNEDNLIAEKTAPISEKVVVKEVKIDEAKLTLLKGIIIDEKTRQPVLATIDLIDNKTNQILATFESNATTGRYLVSLPSGKNYGLSVKANGFLFHSENFDLPDTAQYQEIEKEIVLKKMEVGSKIVLRNIFFDFNKSTLRPESNSELENLLTLLNENPKLNIEISGHTDNVGSAAYNKKLGESRAQAVVTYLVSKGIAKARLTFAGYGFDQPIAPNDTEEGRQLNRRTEFKVLKN